MGTKQFLILIFIACHQISLAGNGMPLKKQAPVDFYFNCSDSKSLHINFEIQQIPGATDETGFKGQERYYIKNTLYVLKKPLFAMQKAPAQDLKMIKQAT